MPPAAGALGHDAGTYGLPRSVVHSMKPRLGFWLAAVSGVASALFVVASPMFGPRASTSEDEARTARILASILPAAPPPDRDEALRSIANSRDRRLIAPLVDLLRFAPSAEVYVRIIEVLLVLTGLGPEEVSEPWREFTVWLGEHTEIAAPAGYPAWKGEMHAQLIDPGFREFLHPGVEARMRVEEIVWGGVRVDGIPALVNPKTLPPEQATYLVDHEPVFGVSLRGDHRAYPLRILDWHEMANDVVGGTPVALAYCTLCGAGILFDTTVDGVTYEFGSSGFLFRSNKLMYDRRTKTLWNQLTGEPVVGPLARSGIRLRVLPVVLTSWGEWKRMHPDTRVLDLHTGHDRPYHVGATYGGYFASPGTMFPVWQRSPRLPAKERIFAIEIDGRPKAYPLGALGRSGGVVNDELGGRTLVVVYREPVGRVPLPEAWRAALRRAGATITLANELTFAAATAAIAAEPALTRELSAEALLAMPVEERLRLLTERSPADREGRDAPPGMFSPDLRNEVAQRGLAGETRAYARGSHVFRRADSLDRLLDENGRDWRVAEEALIASDEERLERLGGHLAYWFGWYAFHPATEVYDPPQASAPPTRPLLPGQPSAPRARPGS